MPLLQLICAEAREGCWEAAREENRHPLGTTRRGAALRQAACSGVAVGGGTRTYMQELLSLLTACL